MPTRHLLDLYEAFDTDTSLAVSKGIGLVGGVGEHGFVVAGLPGARERFTLHGSSGV